MKVELRNVTKAFPSRNKKSGEEVIAVNDCSFTIPDGKLIGLLGPSGCGKSTTLYMICGLQKPTKGQIFFGEDDVTGLAPENRGVGLVFQNYALYPHLTVKQNILFPLQNLKGADKLSKEEMLKRAYETAKLVQIDELMDRKPSELSGGQQQRVAIARALVKMPRVLLLDEPLSNLDARLRLQTREEIRRIQRETKITTVFVTHDQDEAIEVADEIIITNRGRIEQVGTPIEIYRHPQTSFTATFFGHTSVLADYQKYHTFQRMDGVEKAIVRPEFLKITRKNEVQKYGSSASKGVVERTSFRGDWIELAVRVHGDLLIAKRDLEEEPITVGETVDVFLYRLFVIAGEKCYLLENQSLQDDSVFI